MHGIPLWRSGVLALVIIFERPVDSFNALRVERCASLLYSPAFKSHSALPIHRLGAREKDDDADDDDEDIQVDTRNFSPPGMMSFGLGRGRSAPSHRKAVGRSGSSSTSVHVCTNCGSEYVKWIGRCPTCKEWNTIQEFRVNRGGPGGANGSSFGSIRSRPSFDGESDVRVGHPRKTTWLDGVEIGTSHKPVRMTDIYEEMGFDSENPSSFRPGDNRLCVPGDEELNNVLGGGIMPGSLTLLGGDPGVGKSTLLLQTAGAVASLSLPSRGIGMGKDDNSQDKQCGPVIYVSGEENAMQVASRAARLGIRETELLFLCETNADFISDTVASYYDRTLGESIDFSSEKEEASYQAGPQRPPCLVVIDSIQTMICDSGGSSAAGGVTQV
mmetsp:Transcript_11685/g.34349  ORF Transcript_11685/g.34349 Transcript_11685/m.34349 type:complete len:386 (+) Transcript_11685:97-1254(+)